MMEGQTNDPSGSLTPILSCVRCVCAVPGNEVPEDSLYPDIAESGELVFAQNPAGPQSRNL
jgi:hypothetical protein